MRAAAYFMLGLVFAGNCAAEDLQEGKPAPPVELQLLNGQRFSLAGQAGKVVILNFWATWCPPCAAEMAALETYYSQHKTEGLAVVAVSVDDPRDEAKVRKAMREYTFAGALARDSRIDGYGPISRVPLTFVIDRRGILRKDGWRGNPGIDLPSLEWLVTPYLPGPAE